jgi:hypothetical protein
VAVAVGAGLAVEVGDVAVAQGAGLRVCEGVGVTVGSGDAEESGLGDAEAVAAGVGVGQDDGAGEDSSRTSARCTQQSYPRSPGLTTSNAADPVAPTCRSQSRIKATTSLPRGLGFGAQGQVLAGVVLEPRPSGTGGFRLAPDSQPPALAGTRTYWRLSSLPSPPWEQPRAASPQMGGQRQALGVCSPDGGHSGCPCQACGVVPGPRRRSLEVAAEWMAQPVVPHPSSPLIATCWLCERGCPRPSRAASVGRRQGLVGSP